MNSTSFTSIDRSSGDSGAAQAGLSMQLDASDKMDSSSTAPLTLAETPVVMVAGAGGRPVRFSHPSDSEEPDASPSVTVLTLSSSSAASNGPNCSQHQQLQPHRHHSSNGNTNSSNNKNNNSSHRQMNQSNSLHLKHHPHHHSSNHHHLHAHQQHPSLTRPTQLLSSGFSLSNRLTKHQRTLWSRANSFEKLLMFIVLLLATLAIVLLIALVSVFMAHRRHFELEHGSNQSASAGAGLAAAASSTRFNAQQEVTYGERAHMTPASSHPLFSNKSFCLTPDCVKVAASVIEAIDLTIDPCDDFYLYSCGDWIKSNPLPDGKSNWGTFSKLWQDNQSIMRAVLEGVNFKPGSAEEKAKVYYESCLDRNDTVELRGTKPMQDLIESAGGWSISGAFNVKEWDLQSSLQIYHNQYNRGGLFSWAVGADERNSTRNIIQLDQGGLGLPSRDYYLNKTDKNVLDSYLIYMIKVAELMGGTNVEEQMKDVLEFEKKLAGITVPQDQRRDDERMYHKLTLRELSNRSSFINWTKYFDDAFDYHSRTTISFSSEIRPRNTGANGSASSATTSDAHTHNHQQHHNNNNNNNNNNHHHHHHHEQDEPKNRSASRADNGKQAAVPASSRPAPVLDEADDDDDFEDEAPTTLSAKAAAAIAAIAREPTSTPSPAELATASATARASATLAAQSSPMGSGSPPVSTIKKHKITEEENIVIYSPEYFDDLSTLINQYAKTDRGKITLANYMAWSVIQSLIATLPKNFRDASKALRKALIGSEGIEVSWRYCVTDTNQVMGFALGSLFVRRVFQGKSKERAEEMIYSIRDAFKDNLSNLNWMDDRTRMLAREKADHINQMIGFPDFILNPEKLNGKYEGLELDENNYFENNIKVNVLSLRENMEKINMPANKTEWEMTPPMVNAYYTPTKNQIVFPAGILQTPFYDLSYPNSLNYGAMGVVMGHELTHAFDDQGREYDKDGNLYQWWYNETLKNFEDRVKCFVDQYSSYKVDESNLNGKQTLGENIADNGGLKAAFRAFEKWSEQHPEPNLPGLNLTSKQLFFVGFAQVWCSVSTPEALKLQVLNDPHAPAQFRVIGTLSNSQEFAREFNCPVGSKMNPEKKCLVW